MTQNLQTKKIGEKLMYNMLLQNNNPFKGNKGYDYNNVETKENNHSNKDNFFLNNENLLGKINDDHLSNKIDSLYDNKPCNAKKETKFQNADFTKMNFNADLIIDKLKEHRIIDLNYKYSNRFILAILFFIFALVGFGVLILIYLKKKKLLAAIFNIIFNPDESTKILAYKDLQNFKFPNFFKLINVDPLIYSTLLALLAACGYANVWSYCSMLLQRFSVPEFKNNKILLNLMFITGIIANTLIISILMLNEISIFEFVDLNIKSSKVSCKKLAYLIYIIMIILFTFLGIKNLESLRNQIQCADENFAKKFKFKKILLALSLLLMTIYLVTLAIDDYKQTQIQNHENFIKNFKKITLQNAIRKWTLLIIPYLLYNINALIHLTYYYDIVYIQKKLSIIIDKEYFFNDDSKSLLLA